ncbi:NAD(P)/FAD-dependent oxidoreductase [Paracandidimonas soli]|uniref:Sarcosine oxidase subunit beta n=1 Tax=Paracandidimonas soli TaxID=1917182 RepID=A0A4R3VFZ3_9BURK|nr:FAD-dependent oxidoreductase [Paracandidimonas soli]TCV02943.1 sarcosine oxidase subunit beta [Paracandidimonas soli]
MNRISTTAAIIGGGLIGCASALFLRRMGIETLIIERGNCGACASGVNFGGVRRQGRARAQLPLAMRAHEIWSELPAWIGTDGEYMRSGHLKLARSLSDLQALADYRDRVSDFDLGLQILEGAAFRRRYPEFGPGVIGGSLCPEDGQANPRLVAPAFARAAQSLGARLLAHTRIMEAAPRAGGFALRTEQGTCIHADFVVNAAGAWGHDIARLFDEDLPQTPGYPTMAVTEPLPCLLGVSLGVEGGGFYARQVERGNVVMGGGFGESVDHDLRARPGRAPMQRIAEQAGEILPALRHAHLIRFWSGVEGYTPDKQPYLGPSTKHSGLIHAFGFSGAGFQISPAAGEAVAQLLAHGSAPLLDAAFSPGRHTTAATNAKS